MEAATLKPPKTGQSRFSKALPAPPALPTFEFGQSQLSLSSPPSQSLPPLVPEKALPQRQPGPETPLPPLPPPKGLGLGLGLELEKEWDRETIMTTTTTIKPLNSPLPPLPPHFTSPKPMSIPRRPVAARVVSPPPTATPAPVAAPTPAPAPAPAATLAPTPTSTSPNPPLSPVGSISSLLSAYSNHTADPTPRSSLSSTTKDVTDSQNAYSVVSPNLVTQRSGTNSDAPSQPSPRPWSGQHAETHDSNGRPSLEKTLSDFPPPPPLKDAKRGQPRPETPTGLRTDVAQPQTSGQSGSPLRNTSPQQDQLWRRRSLKSDKNFAVPELKLVSSHGSTAASAQNSSLSGPSSTLSQPLPPPPRIEADTLEPTTTTPAPPPRSANAGLPGRNIRPVPPSEQIAPQGEANMGQETSRIKEKLRNERRRESDSEAKQNAPEVQVTKTDEAPSPAASSLPTVSPLSAARLPTPDYGTNDVKSPLPATVISPLSPASTPELAGEKKALVPRKPISPTESQLRHAKSTPSLSVQTRNPGLAVQSPIGLPKSPRPDRGANQAQLPPPPRTGEINQPSPTIPHRGPTSPTDSQGPYQKGPWDQTHSRGVRSVSETGSIETVKPYAPYRRPDSRQSPIEEQPLPLREHDPNQPDTTDNPGAALFPRNWYTPRPADEIPDARPLTDRQFRCLTNHRYMTANRQRTNPIGCRTCGHKDRNAECYICSACHLNVCSGCTGLLRRFRGDLRAVLREVEEKKAEKTAMTEESATATILEE